MRKTIPSAGRTAAIANPWRATPRTLLLIGAVTLAGMVDHPAALRGQPAQAGRPKLPPALEQARKYATPGEQHRLLDSIVGSFDTTAKYWLMPGREALQVRGSIESKWILDGRFVEFVYKTELFGDPYEGRALIGYDNYAKKYVATWVDTKATFVLQLEGECDAGCKTRTMETTFTDPVSGQTVELRDVTTILDKTSFRYEAYLEFSEGQNFKQAEITATRRH